MAWSYKGLWHILLDRGMKKTDLKDAVHITSNLLAQLGKNQPVSMTVIGRLCEYFNCRLQDIVEYIPGEDPEPIVKKKRASKDKEAPKDGIVPESESVLQAEHALESEYNSEKVSDSTEA